MEKNSSYWSKPMFKTLLRVLKNSGIDNTIDFVSVSDVKIQESVDKWLEKYSYVKPTLAIKFGPMQMAYNYYVYRLIFKYLYDSGREEELKSVLNNALQVNDNWLGYYEVSAFLQKVKVWDSAWSALKNAINKNPKFSLSYTFDFIKTAYNAGKLNEAEQLVKNYILINPKHSHPYLFAGRFYYYRNKTDQATLFFKEAISKEKSINNDPGSYLFAAQVFLKNNMRNEANQALSIILNSIDPHNEQAKKMMIDIENKS